MENLPIAMQVVIVFVLGNVLPLTITVVAGRWRRFPSGLRFPLILGGIFGSEKLIRVMPISQEVKETGNWIFVVTAGILLILILKYDWFSDNREDTNHTNSPE